VGLKGSSSGALRNRLVDLRARDGDRPVWVQNLQTNSPMSVYVERSTECIDQSVDVLREQKTVCAMVQGLQYRCNPVVTTLPDREPTVLQRR
jgi:hypothetical protein